MKKKVLLVDDSRTTLAMERMILSSGTDYDLLCANDGVEAVEKASAEVPDLILMDVVMPRMNGLEACRKLRQQESTCNLPIILVTTRGREQDVEAGFEHGCNDYLTKPIRPEELVTMVKAYLGD